MTVGFQIFLADGTTVQADDTYRNLSVREQGSVATTTLNAAGGTSSVIFYRTGLTTPLLAVGGPGYAASQMFFDAPNNRHGFIITSGNGVGTSIPYYIFDVPFDTDPHFGLQVFNSAGQKTFDIMQKYLRVIDMFTTAARPGTTRSYDPSRTYACIHMRNGWSINYSAGNTMLTMSKSGAGVVTTSGGVVDGNQGINVTYETLSTVLVLDVTYY